jgi:zinc transport system permease protein
MMVGASLLGMVFTVSGLWLSYAFDLTSGATIILVAGGAFFLTLVLEYWQKRRRSAVPEASRS